MWTSERRREFPVREAPAELGTVTLGGDPAALTTRGCCLPEGVVLGGERRWLPVYGPGGYSWRPTAGDKVLVLKAGAEGEAPCILGKVQQGEELKAGEVKLSGGASSILLGQETLELEGDIRINGTTLEAYIAQVLAELLG